jgi:RNA polymerase-binding transcription factor DksA
MTDDALAETNTTETGRSLLARVRSNLDDVDAALTRLDEGTYGRCEACGASIGADRLSAFPAARYCLGHDSGH